MSLFLCIPSLRLSYTSCKAFFLKKKSNGIIRIFRIRIRRIFEEKYLLFYLIKFHCGVVFASSYIGQCVYCSCFLTNLWRHKFSNFQIFEKPRQKINHLENKNGFCLRVTEFSSYKIELRNRVAQNQATPRLTNYKVFIEILLSSY